MKTSKKVSALIRMYRLKELGECFLISFNHNETQTRVLIDCGSFRNSPESTERLAEIVKHIFSEEEKIDVIVGTHQHNDHVSGFYHHEKEFEKRVKEVWLSWIEDPEDEVAKEIKAGEKKLNVSLRELHKIFEEGLSLAEHRERMMDVLMLGGLDDRHPEVPERGINILRSIGENNKLRYLKPGDIFGLPGLTEEVKVYVLGPPMNVHQIRHIRPKKGESYDLHLFSVGDKADELVRAFRQETIQANIEGKQMPFAREFQVSEKEMNIENPGYFGPTEAWRKIQSDAGEEAEQLAMYLHSFTNNTSLVLAFELVKSKKVLLFAADAQTGNWNSWDTIPWEALGQHPQTTDNLLNNTVLYKVGHHGSHNSTTVSGLERMTHEQLVCMISVHIDDPMLKKEKPWKMPEEKLEERLYARTDGRVLRMDDWIPTSVDPAKEKEAWSVIANTPNVNDLFKELKIE